MLYKINESKIFFSLYFTGKRNVELLLKYSIREICSFSLDVLFICDFPFSKFYKFHFADSTLTRNLIVDFCNSYFFQFEPQIARNFCVSDNHVYFMVRDHEAVLSLTQELQVCIHHLKENYSFPTMTKNNSLRLQSLASTSIHSFAETRLSLMKRRTETLPKEKSFW